MVRVAPHFFLYKMLKYIYLTNYKPKILIHMNSQDKTITKVQSTSIINKLGLIFSFTVHPPETELDPTVF